MKTFKIVIQIILIISLCLFIYKSARFILNEIEFRDYKDKRLEQLKDSAKLLDNQVKKSIVEIDSLYKVLNTQKDSIDKVYKIELKKIRNEYEKNHVWVSNLSPTEQVKFFSEWVSKIDTVSGR